MIAINFSIRNFKFECQEKKNQSLAFFVIETTDTPNIQMDELNHLFGNGSKNRSKSSSRSSQSKNNHRRQRSKTTNDVSFLTLLRQKYPQGVSGEELMNLLSSHVQSRQRELRSGESNLSLNTPCLSHLSMCVSHQRDTSSKVALPNASRMDHQRRATLKLSIMFRELAHLCLHQPKSKSNTSKSNSKSKSNSTSTSNSDLLPCDLSIFPTLRVLEARGVQPKQLLNLNLLRSTLEVLSLESGAMASPSKILSSSSGTDNFIPWSRLTTLRLSKCNMTVLDASVSLLTSAVVIQMNDNNLHDVGIGLSVLPRLPRLQHLDLSFNRISSLVGKSKYKKRKKGNDRVCVQFAYNGLSNLCISV